MLNKVIQHAKEKKIGMVSYWSMNRDAIVDGGQGKVKNQYEFLTVAQQFVIILQLNHRIVYCI